MKHSARLLVSRIGLGATLLACHGPEGPTNPSLAGPAPTSRSSTPSKQSHEADTVRTLKRLVPLPSTVSVSAVIGAGGGSLAIPAAGATVVFPEGALAEPTVITMTAKAGYDVAYDFEPHLEFPVPVIVQQSLHNTAAELNPEMLSRLGGAYFENDLAANFVDARRLYARVKELRPGTVDDGGGLLTFTVNHFSGYLASSGRSGRDDKDD